MPGRAGRLVMDRPEKLIVGMGRVLIAGKSPPPADRLHPNLCGPAQRAASEEGAWSCSEGGALRGLSCRAFAGAPLRRDRLLAEVSVAPKWRSYGRGPGCSRNASTRRRAPPARARPTARCVIALSLRSRDPCAERPALRGLFCGSWRKRGGAESLCWSCYPEPLFSVNRMINARRSSVL